MKYGIVANPVSGRLGIDRKRSILEQLARTLDQPDCEVVWLDTTSPAFRESVVDLASRVDTLIVAGGDGTLHAVNNCVSPETVKAYLPFGSGNFSGYALGYALGYPRNQPRFMPKIAKQIIDGKEHSLDLILCDEVEKAIIASVGIDGRVLVEREKYLQEGVKGFNAYAKAFEKLLFKGLEQFDATLTINGSVFPVEKAVSIIVTKVPFYGYGLNVVPRANFKSGKLHLLTLNTSEFVFGLLTSFFRGNKAGCYRTGTSIRIDTEKQVYLQMDGEVGRKGTSFRFDVLRGELKMRY